MIYKKIKNGETNELIEISCEEAFRLAGTESLMFDSPIEELNFYKELIKKYPPFPKKNNKTNESHISELLQYLEDEELHEIAVSILNDEENGKYENLDYAELFPYLDETDTDLLFFKVISDNAQKIDIEELAPYVSDEAFTKFTDEFLNGNYQNVDIDAMYPYMKSSDIKRLFDYYLSKKSSSYKE